MPTHWTRPKPSKDKSSKDHTSTYKPSKDKHPRVAPSLKDTNSEPKKPKDVPTKIRTAKDKPPKKNIVEHNPNSTETKSSDMEAAFISFKRYIEQLYNLYNIEHDRVAQAHLAEDMYEDYRKILKHKDEKHAWDTVAKKYDEIIIRRADEQGKLRDRQRSQERILEKKVDRNVKADNKLDHKLDSRIDPRQRGSLYENDKIAKREQRRGRPEFRDESHPKHLKNQRGSSIYTESEEELPRPRRTQSGTKIGRDKLQNDPWAHSYQQGTSAIDTPNQRRSPVYVDVEDQRYHQQERRDTDPARRSEQRRESSHVDDRQRSDPRKNSQAMVRSTADSEHSSRRRRDSTYVEGLQPPRAQTFPRESNETPYKNRSLKPPPLQRASTETYNSNPPQHQVPKSAGNKTLPSTSCRQP